jgi:hypothetical protein
VKLSAIVFFAATGLRAQSAVDWTFDDLQGAIATLQISQATSEDESAELQTISDSLDVIHNRYKQRFGGAQEDAASIQKNISKEYSLSMNADLSLLRSLPSDHPNRLAGLKDIHADLAMKASFVSRTLGAAGAFPSVITLTVDTVASDGQKVSGFWVRCNPHRYGVGTNPLFVFNSASTPTAAVLPPGAFTCWVEDVHKTVLASQPVNLGGSGSSSEYLKFSLP